jgi:hypothetical protein
MWSRELLRAIYEEIHKAARAVVAPFTRGGKLDLSSPNIVGHLPVSRGGTGGTGGIIPPPYAYLVDDDGAYLVDGDGAYLFEYL